MDSSEWLKNFLTLCSNRTVVPKGILICTYAKNKHPGLFMGFDMNLEQGSAELPSTWADARDVISNLHCEAPFQEKSIHSASYLTGQLVPQLLDPSSAHFDVTKRFNVCENCSTLPKQASTPDYDTEAFKQARGTMHHLEGKG